MKLNENPTFDCRIDRCRHFCWIYESHLNPYYRRILNLCAIYGILAVTFNLIFGYTGQFSLGHAGFAAIGAYVAALLTLHLLRKR